jgi:hypothetical protein
MESSASYNWLPEKQRNYLKTNFRHFGRVDALSMFAATFGLRTVRTPLQLRARQTPTHVEDTMMHFIAAC